MSEKEVLAYREVVAVGSAKFPNGQPKEADIKLRMHAGQKAAYDSKAREVLVLAGTQGGKTCFGPDWLYQEIANRGPGDYLIGTATFPLLKLKVLPEFLLLFRDILGLGVWKDAEKVFECHDKKTRVIVFSATNPESIESATAKGAWLDEAGQKQFKREAREAVVRRLSINEGRILYTTTPYGLGWLKTEVYDRAQESANGIDIINFPSTMNPAFPRAEYERQKGLLPSWKFRMFYDGLFDKPVGLVYDAFDEATCKVPRFPIPNGWPVYVGHDFGAANPAAMFYAKDPTTGYIYAWHCYRPRTGKSVAERVADFRDIVAGRTVMKRAGGSHQEEEIREAYRAHGWPIVEPGRRTVEEQIQRVYGLHRLNKLYVFNDMAAYLDEKLSYSYKLDEKYQPLDEIEDSSSFHLMDAERYILSDFTPETAEHQGNIIVTDRLAGLRRPAWSHWRREPDNSILVGQRYS